MGLLTIGAFAHAAGLTPKALRAVLPGDRYLLCSDGLSAVVGRPDLETTLSADTDPEDVVQALVDLAHDSGAPDNIACIVADMVAV